MLPQDEPELSRHVEHILSRWILGHDYSATAMQAACLRMNISREDFFRVARLYCDLQTENRTLGKQRNE